MSYEPPAFEEPDYESLMEADYERRMDHAYDSASDFQPRGEDEFWEAVADAITEQARESAIAYYGRFGDAVSGRVDKLLGEAGALAEKHPGASICLTATAVELTLGYLVVRPLVQGAFLSEEWAAILTARIIRGGARSGLDRAIVPAIATAWGIDIAALQLPNGRRVWPFLDKELFEIRNAFSHQGEPVSVEEAQTAVACTGMLRSGLLEAIAKQLGLWWPEVAWSDARPRGMFSDTPKRFEPESPFEPRRGRSRGVPQPATGPSEPPTGRTMDGATGPHAELKGEETAP